MAADTFEVRRQLRAELGELAGRYVAHHQGHELDGLAALGEDLLMHASYTEGRTSWLALLMRLQRLSG